MTPAAPKIIAEIGSVHDGSFGNALKAIELAAELGVDIVKFQTHLASFESTASAPSPKHFEEEPRFEYFERTGFSETQWRKLREAAEENQVEFMSSPFSTQAVDLLEGIGAGIYKVASGEVTNIPLLERIAATGKPTLLSTGMSTWAEIDAAVEILNRGRLVLMQCSSMYPCEPSNVGLNVLGEMRQRYGSDLTLGFSDHTSGIAAAAAAAALGATVIEKHLTFSKRMYGSDARFALEPDQFNLFVRAVREVWEIMDNPVEKDDVTPYAEARRVFQKSIVAARDLEAGQHLMLQDLAFKKPGGGVSPANYREFLGRRLLRHKTKDALLTYEDLQ